MSEDKKYTEIPTGTRKVTLEVKEFLWKRLEAQIRFLEGMKIPELSSVKKPEDLILYYIEQLCLPQQHQQEMSKKIGEVLELFNKQGVNMRQLLNAFTHQEEEVEEEESD